MQSIPTSFLELFRLAEQNLNNKEIGDGFAKLLETLVAYANRNEPRVFPKVAAESPILLKRMYTRLIWEMRCLVSRADQKVCKSPSTPLTSPIHLDSGYFNSPLRSVLS